MSITAKVYSGTSPGTLIATLNSRRNPNWLDQLNDTGSGSVQIHLLDSDLASNPTLTNYYNLVRMQIDGVDRYAFIIENPDLDPVPTDEASGQWWTLGGRGVLALLEDAIVYPEAPLAESLARDRTFGFMAMAYDDSAWTAAVEIQRQDAAGAYTGAPSGWPLKTTYWIWSRAMAGSPLSAPAGTSYFRKTFTLADDTPVAVFAACDNEFRLWLDDEAVIDNLGSAPFAGWHDFERYDAKLVAGDHVIAVEALNNNLRTGDPSVAAFICTVIETDGSLALTTTVTTRTDSTWLALDYPASKPGMTPGEILRIPIEEAQARGGLVGVTLGFTDANDSNSNPWAVVPDFAVQIGAPVLDIVRALVEQFIDVQMTPTLVLNAYNKGTLGSDLTGSVSLLRGTHFEELGGQSSGHLTNAMLLRTQVGSLLERTDATSLGARKRKEAYVEVGSAPSDGQAQKIADAVFPDFAYPIIQLSGKVTASSGPYTTYRPGDTIKMPNKANVATSSTVMSLAVEADEAGNPIYHIEALQTDS